MKKTLRKLSLSRETLRTLERPHLLEVGGARPAPSGNEQTCPWICDPVHLLTELC
jgi:hypothetical protein